jgi:hypothetical protein
MTLEESDYHLLTSSKNVVIRRYHNGSPRIKDPFGNLILKEEVYCWLRDQFGPEFHEFFDLDQYVYADVSEMKTLRRKLREEVIVPTIVPGERQWCMGDAQIAFRKQSNAMLFKLVWG